MPDPGYSATQNRATRRAALTLKASGAETSSTTSAAVEIQDGGMLFLNVNITAASGTTPTMTVVIEGSDDNATWYQLGTIGLNGYTVGSVPPNTAPSNFTAVSNTLATMPGSRFVRSRSVIGGTTPSFTYSVIGNYAFA